MQKRYRRDLELILKKFRRNYLLGALKIYAITMGLGLSIGLCVVILNIKLKFISQDYNLALAFLGGLTVGVSYTIPKGIAHVKRVAGIFTSDLKKLKDAYNAEKSED
jgi:hypothetical protein